MSELEDLLKKHTDDIGKALGEFKGQIDTIDSAVKALTDRADHVEAKANRLSLGGVSPVEEKQVEVKQLKISNEDRKTIGAIMKGEIGATEAKQMQIRMEADGGLLVPEQTATQIEYLIRRQSPMRNLARVVNMDRGNILYPISRGAFEAGWVGENDSRDETDSATIAAMQPSGGTVYALPVATEEVIDDAIINLEQFITDNVVDVIAEQESKAFIDGDGIKKPRGFIHRNGERAPVATADATRKLGVLQYISTGAAGDLGTGGNFTEKLVSMIFATKAGYRQAPGTAWAASTDMIGALAKLKDGEGRPLYTPSLREGIPGQLLGYPVVEMEHMDAVAAGTFPIAFGNWQRGYQIGDRTSLNILRDPYTTKGKIKWYFRKRVYGEVLNSEAIKLLKVAAN
jgi:HK97 family phage major capsid protein